MQLWPDEYEDLREEARSLMETIAGLIPVTEPDPNETLDDRVRRERAVMDNFVQESPLAQLETIAGVPCRVFAPDGAARAVYVDIHGGGMMVGRATNDDQRNVAYMQDHRVAVVSIDYRLAPEHPFPAGSDDCVAVTRWLLEHGESRFGSAGLLIGGESAGAYYSALTMLRVRDELGAIDRILGANLIFGVYDLSRTPSQRGVRISDGFDILSAPGIEFIMECYCPGAAPEELRSPKVSPLYADLRGLPPALFTVGTDDHVLDDSLFMSARYAAAGNETELAVYPDCAHGFTMFPTQLAKRASERIGEFLERVLSD